MTSALIRIDPQSIVLSNIADVQNLLKSVQALYALSPVRSISFAPTGNPDEYAWNVTGVDGRTWNEVMLFNSSEQQDTNPSVTMDVPRGWFVNELVVHRELRDQIIRLRNTIKLNVFDMGWIDSETPSSSVVELEVEPGTVKAGDPVKVSWLAPSAGQLDWIGLFAAGSDVHLYLAYVYAAGANSGSHVFTAPSTPGQYVFRYLLNNGYTSVADSVTFTVVAS